MLEVARWWICLRYQTVILHYSLLFRVVNPLTVDLRLFTTICYHQMSRVKLHEVRMQAWLCTLYLTLCSLSVSDQGVLPNCSLITPWMLRARTILLWVQSRLLREPKSGTELDQKWKRKASKLPQKCWPSIKRSALTTPESLRQTCLLQIGVQSLSSPWSKKRPSKSQMRIKYPQRKVQIPSSSKTFKSLVSAQMMQSSTPTSARKEGTSWFERCVFSLFISPPKYQK